ncbi:XRE family transcriptional regulator [Amycolatopsis halotolerans]
MPMSREELAGLVAERIALDLGKPAPFDANHLGKLERGAVQRPSAIVRAALCSVLDAGESELGFTSHGERERVVAALSGKVATDADALRAIAGVLAGVRRLEDATGAADVLPTVHAQRSMVDRLAQNARGQVRAEAVGLLSELEQYLGWLSIPLDRWSQSRQHLDRAATLALEAGDPDRLSTALSFSAYRNLRRDNLQSAEALNEAAGRDTRVNVGLRTYTKFQRAEVLARDGQSAESRRVLADAERLTEGLPIDPEELPTAGYWYIPSFFLGQRAFVLAALGEKQEAARTAREAIAEMPPAWRTAEWAGRRLKLAELDS